MVALLAIGWYDGHFAANRDLVKLSGEVEGIHLPSGKVLDHGGNNNPEEAMNLVTASVLFRISHPLHLYIEIVFICVPLEWSMAFGVSLSTHVSLDISTNFNIPHSARFLSCSGARIAR